MDKITQCLESFLCDNLQGKNNKNKSLIDLLLISYSLKKDKPIMNTDKLASFLTKIGFYQNVSNNGLNYSFFNKGILYKNINRDMVSSFMLKAFKQVDPNCKNSESDLSHKLNLELNKHLKKETHVVGILDQCHLKEYRDTKNCTRIFFKNIIVVVEVLNNSVEVKTETYEQFSKLKQYINSKKIIDFNYEPKKANSENTVFKKLLEKITNDEWHYLSIISVIGFFMNTHKSKKDPIIFVLSDEKSLLKNDAYGQSFKSEGLEAGIQHVVKPYFFENAQNFNKNFPFQNIRPEYDLFIFGDAPKNFNIKILYEAKRGIDVEQKGRSKTDFFIPYEYSPKILIDTNYRLGTEKSSDKGRIFRITINNYFDADYTPYDEFKHELFTDWNKTNWNDFYSFMINCAGYYLLNGLKRYSNEKLHRLAFANQTSLEFVEFIKTELKLNEWYFLSNVSKKVMPEAYNESKTKASRILSNWLREYCGIKNLVFTTKTGTGNKSIFKISETNLFNNDS